jgi:hypothetical protein
MRKVIINVCKWIISKLESDAELGINRRGYNKKNQPTGVKHTNRHHGVWLVTADMEQFYRTQEDAAIAASERFGFEVKRWDISNAIHKRNGEFIVKGKTLCIFKHTLD